MTKIEMIELARAYVALSNAHRLKLIGAMFDEASIYHSSALGRFQGVDTITEMMAGFFASYPDVHWQADNYCVDGNRVSFDFNMTASRANPAVDLRRRGLETIEFDDSGIIRELQVDASETTQ